MNNPSFCSLHISMECVPSSLTIYICNSSDVLIIALAVGYKEDFIEPVCQTRGLMSSAQVSA